MIQTMEPRVLLSAATPSDSSPAPPMVSADDVAPTLTATSLDPTYTEGDPAVDLFSSVTASTVEGGQTFTSMILTVSNVFDGFEEILSIDGTDLMLFDESAATTAINGLTVDVAVAGTTASVRFFGAALDEAALQTLVDTLSYRNTSANPTDADRAITITTLADSGSDVSPNANTANPNITSIVNVEPGPPGAPDQEPTLTATGETPTFTEGGPAVDLFSGVTASTVDAGQTFSSMTLIVSGVSDGANEILNLDGSDVTLIDEFGVVTATNGLTVTVNVSGDTATVTILNATLSEAALQTLVDGLSYRNASSTPTDADRTITITQLVDSGSNVLPSDNTAAFNIVSTVNVDPANSVPVAAASSVTAVMDTAKTFAVADFQFTDTESDLLVSITISSLNLAVGDTLQLSSVDVLVNDTIIAADIANLVYTPAPGAHGAARSTFDFTVNDAGPGTVAATMTINVIIDPNLVVTTTADTINGGDGAISLREAILFANGNPGTDTISFNIPGAGVHTIFVTSQLPDLTEAVIIDGTTQGVNATPLIELDGSGAGVGTIGLVIMGGDSTVSGLAISRFNASGIRLINGNGNVVIGNLIGTDAAGTADQGNGKDGVQIINSDNNSIGGTTAAERNLISGNNRYGIWIDSASTGNVVFGNLIGTDLAGTGDLGNTLHGVLIQSALNTIGGNTAETRNVISGNDQFGVYLTTAGATGNVVQGNYIGTDINGTADLGNTLSGVQIDGGAASNTIGGTLGSQRNIISGNNGYGVRIQGFPTTTLNTVSGNYIGTDVSGTAAIGNSLSGVQVNAAGNTIGGALDGAGNLISGNVQHGVLIQGGVNAQNVVAGNFIGTDAAGTADLGNLLSGVQVLNSSGNTIGGATLIAAPTNYRNIISGNNENGVHLVGGGTTGTLVQGNFIGTNASGTADLGNTLSGVLVTTATNTIGGTTAGEGNVISGNDRFGITIQGAAATGNNVQANRIGTNAAGTGAIGNSLSGITLYDAGSNTVGGTTASARNVISGNVQNGVYLSQAGATNNVVQGNYIGTDINGTADLGNLLSGVLFESKASSNTIGGTAAGAGNVISGNNQHGVHLLGFGGVGVGVRLNLVQGNFIGTDVSGTADLGNTLNGVQVQATANTIGGAAAGAGNLISGNDQNGVQLQGGVTAATLVQGNLIGTQADGTSALANSQNGVQIVHSSGNTVGGTTAGSGNTIAWNTQDGVSVSGTDVSASNNAIWGNSNFSNGDLGIDLNANGQTTNDVDDPDLGPNHLQNFPAFASVILNGPNLDITYSVPSLTTNSVYPLRVEFFIADAANQEGQTFLGSDNYAAPGAKLATISAGASVVGTKIVATATDANGNTSEFSLFATVA